MMTKNRQRKKKNSSAEDQTIISLPNIYYNFMVDASRTTVETMNSNISL